MNVEQIKELISIVEKSDITSFELEESGYRIRIGKEESSRMGRQNSYFEPAKSVSSQVKSSDVEEIKPIETAAPVAEVKAIDTSSLVEIKSPMLGVFYASPSPDAEPFVKIGDRIKKGQVLCIVEAMKLMNEIHAEKEGEIAEICIENGQIVEFGQAIFKLK